MTSPLLHAMMNDRSPRTRNLARQIARGRTRGVPQELLAAVQLTNKVVRNARQVQNTQTPYQFKPERILNNDGAGNAGVATSSDFGNTPTYTSVPKARKRVLGL